MEKKEYIYEYPRPAMTTDCVVVGFDGSQLKILLIERGVEPYKGMWALPGGFIQENETAENCAMRELQEETGLHVTTLKQLQLFSTVDRDPRGRVITMAFYALVRSQEVHGGDDAANAQWFNIDQLPKLAFDHQDIITAAMQQLKRDIHFEPIGFNLLDTTFTIPQLQMLYELILGVKFDRRNFPKKMLQFDIITPAEEQIGECYYGDHHEMKAMSIDALFSPEPIQHSRGRKPKKFLFNKTSYDKIKKDNDFKLEF